MAGQYPTTFWSIFEVNLALICASAPALKQFVGGTFPAVREYASNLTSKASRSGHSGAGEHKGSVSSSSKMSWSKKSSKWGFSLGRKYCRWYHAGDFYLLGPTGQGWLVLGAGATEGVS